MIIVKNNSKDGQSGYSGRGEIGFSGWSGESGYIGQGNYIAPATIETLVVDFNQLLNELKYAGIMEGTYSPPS